MKKILLMMTILPFMISCKGEKSSKSKLSDEEESKISLELKLMENARIYSDSAFNLLDNNSENGIVKKVIVDKHKILLEKSLEQAKKVDVITLDKIKKGFGKKYKEKYIRSLELQLEGMQEVDMKKSLDGQILYDEYVNYMENIKN